MPEYKANLSDRVTQLERELNDLRQAFARAADRPAVASDAQDWEWAKLDADLSPCGKANATVYWEGASFVGSSGCNMASTTAKIVVHAPPYDWTGTVTASTWIRVKYHHRNQKWYAVGRGDCTA